MTENLLKSLQITLSKIRSDFANPAILEFLKVSYQGNEILLNFTISQANQPLKKQ